MPTALLKACPGDGGRCTALVTSGRCPVHARQADRRRGSAASRGYDRRWTRRRAQFFGDLIAAGVTPVCGARLPGALVTTHSACAAAGLLTAHRLQVDHIVPPDGPDDPRFWHDRNYQVLCHQCHSAKTTAEDGGAGNAVRAHDYGRGYTGPRSYDDASP